MCAQCLSIKIPTSLITTLKIFSFCTSKKVLKLIANSVFLPISKKRSKVRFGSIAKIITSFNTILVLFCFMRIEGGILYFLRLNAQEIRDILSYCFYNAF